MKTFVDEVKGARKKGNNKFILVPVGDTENGAEVAPEHLLTDTYVKYQQVGLSCCMMKSFASALHFLGHKQAASQFSNKAEKAMKFSTDRQLEILDDLMKKELPKLARVKKWNKKNKVLAWNIFEDISDHPTLVIPLNKDGSCSHAVTIVGDKIFDATEVYALKLCRESMEHICSIRNGFERVYIGYRYFGSFVKMNAQEIRLHRQKLRAARKTAMKESDQQSGNKRKMEGKTDQTQPDQQSGNKRKKEGNDQEE